MTRAEWARRRGRSSSSVRRSLRMAIYARDHFDCVYCRLVFPLCTDGRGLTLDHVKPRSRGGRNTAANLVTACKRCNSSRGNRPLTRKQLRRVNAALEKSINRKLGRHFARLSGAQS